MNKKKWIIIGCLVLALVGALVFAVPAMAAAASPTTDPTQITTTNKPGALIRLLLVQDQTKAFAYIARLKLTAKLPPIRRLRFKTSGQRTTNSSPGILLCGVC